MHRRRQRHPCDEGRCRLVVVSVELPAVRFENGTAPMKPKSIMPLAKRAKRLASPIFGGALEIRFRFGEGEDVAPVNWSSRY